MAGISRLGRSIHGGGHGACSERAAVSYRRPIRMPPLLMILGALAVLGSAHLGNSDAEADRRVRLEFTRTRQQVFAELAAEVPGLTAAEFDALDQGRVESRLIDRERRYHPAAARNFLFAFPALQARRRVHRHDPLPGLLLAHSRAVRAASREGQSAVLPRDYRVDVVVRLDGGAVGEHDLVRCWIPFPRALSYQDPGAVIAAPGARFTAGEPDAPARALLLERHGGDPDEPAFSVSFQYRGWAQAPLVPARSAVAPLARAERHRFLAEQPPHVVFTPALIEAVDAIRGAETDRARIARRLYEWIGDHTRYRIAPEYGVIDHIVDGFLARHTGDCGEATLFFLAACRLEGIPCRWQSGWAAWPTGSGPHDWCEIWLDDRGWMPVDPFMSVYAQDLPAADRDELRAFYFGGIDHFRLIANADHGVDLSPPKPGPRNDPVDFQRCEVECAGRSVYFDQLRHSIDIVPIDG